MTNLANKTSISAYAASPAWTAVRSTFLVLCSALKTKSDIINLEIEHVQERSHLARFSLTESMVFNVVHLGRPDRLAGQVLDFMVDRTLWNWPSICSLIDAQCGG
jgi:hypothetical protein